MDGREVGGSKGQDYFPSFGNESPTKVAQNAQNCVMLLFVCLFLSQCIFYFHRTYGNATCLALFSRVVKIK